VCYLILFFPLENIAAIHLALTTILLSGKRTSNWKIFSRFIIETESAAFIDFGSDPDRNRPGKDEEKYSRRNTPEKRYFDWSLFKQGML